MKKQVEFKINVPQFVTFQFDDYKQGEGKFGVWYMYSVEHAGEDCVMFGDEYLKAKLDTLAPLKGKIVEIVKEEQGKAKIWRIFSDGQEVGVNALGHPQTPPQAENKAYRPTKEAIGQRKEIQNTLDYKASNIAKAQARKEDAIRIASCGRDAVLIVTSFYKDSPIIMATDEEKEKFIMEKLQFWRKYLYDNIHNDVPFV